MKIIVGLGNPGKKYENTRHNAGFLFVDALAHNLETSFQEEKKFQAEIAETRIKNEKCLLVKPLTFMNASGKTVREIMQFYKVELKDITVVHDDLDIAPGTYKTTPSSRAAGHNGVQDIIDEVGSQDFFRVRLGIGRPTETLEVCMSSHDYVLLPFQEDEQEKLIALFPEIFTLLKV